MKLLLIGATGRTGRFVADQAVSRRHTVTVIVRAPTELNRDGRLRAVVGNPLHASELTAVFPGHDVTISCLGQRSPDGATLLTDAATAAIEGMRRSEVDRYLVVSQGLLFYSHNPIILVLRLLLARYVSDPRAMEHLVSASEFKWTIVRPPRLKSGRTIRESGLVGRRRWSELISLRSCSMKPKIHNM